jgi:hypothetical protein
MRAASKSLRVHCVVVLAGCLLLAPARAQDAREAALQSMVAAERAFAAATREVGVRNGFLTFFAPDAVDLEPVADGTVRLTAVRERLAAGPPTDLPLTSVLTWRPYIGQVSGDGGIGWLTGPYERRTVATGQTGHGIYFSVWQRQDDGTWKVWLDQGIALPTAWPAAADFRAADEPGPAASAGFGDPEGAVATDASAWAGRLAASVRLHRDGVQPVLGRDAVTKWRMQYWRSLHYRPARTKVSEARDMAVVVGGYDAIGTTGNAEHGVFVRVWQVASDGRWVIVFETSKPA